MIINECIINKIDYNIKSNIIINSNEVCIDIKRQNN